MSDPKLPECDDVEITPEMIEAGANAVHYGFKGPSGLEPDSYDEIAVAAYQAMERIRLGVR